MSALSHASGGLSDLLTLAAIALAYYLGRKHQARKDEEVWRDYGRWLHKQRGEIVGRFQRQAMGVLDIQA